MAKRLWQPSVVFNAYISHLFPAQWPHPCLKYEVRFFSPFLRTLGSSHLSVYKRQSAPPPDCNALCLPSAHTSSCSGFLWPHLLLCCPSLSILLSLTNLLPSPSKRLCTQHSLAGDVSGVTSRLAVSHTNLLRLAPLFSHPLFISLFLTLML